MNIAIGREYINHLAVNTEGGLLNSVSQFYYPVWFSSMLIQAIEEGGVAGSNVDSATSQSRGR